MPMKTMKIDDVKLTWLGHSSFMLESGVLTIYIDPYIVLPNPRKADLILITHDHFDHCANIEKLAKDSTVVVAPQACASKSKAVAAFRAVRPGTTLTEKGIGIQAVDAYNPSKQFHPKGVGVGYFLTVGGVTIYHAGDTDYIPEMNNFPHPDVALLPIGGTYTMDEAGAAEACAVIKPRIAIPMHYGALAQTKGDPSKFKALVAEKSAKTEVKVL